MRERAANEGRKQMARKATSAPSRGKDRALSATRCRGHSGDARTRRASPRRADERSHSPPRSAPSRSLPAPRCPPLAPRPRQNRAARQNAPRPGRPRHSPLRELPKHRAHPEPRTTQPPRGTSPIFSMGREARGKPCFRGRPSAFLGCHPISIRADYKPTRLNGYQSPRTTMGPECARTCGSRFEK